MPHIVNKDPIVYGGGQRVNWGHWRSKPENLVNRISQGRKHAYHLYLDCECPISSRRLLSCLVEVEGHVRSNAENLGNMVGHMDTSYTKHVGALYEKGRISLYLVVVIGHLMPPEVTFWKLWKWHFKIGSMCTFSFVACRYVILTRWALHFLWRLT